MGVRPSHKHPVLIGLFEWVGGAHSRFKDGHDDGRTPRERAGWQTQSLVMEFGEVVQFIPFRAESRADKFDTKLREGVWLGLDSRTDENIVGTNSGICRAATIRVSPRTSIGTQPRSSQSWERRGTPHRTPTRRMELECPTRRPQMLR